MIGQSPPGPLRCGSTTCKVNPAAAAASKALPPRSSTAMPTPLAIQWVEATAPKVPAISGRVVNMLVLSLPATVTGGCGFRSPSGLARAGRGVNRRS